MKNRIQFINHVIRTMDYKTYLEVGVYKGEVFNTIGIEKTGVDIDCDIEGVLKLDSDTFFEDNTNLYDIIFIDGDHNYEQVKKDVENALECLTPNGMVLMHDTCPTKSSHVGKKTHEGMEWCGQAHKVATEYYNSEGFRVFTWNKDFGVTVLVKDSRALVMEYPTTFEYLIKSNYESVNAKSLNELNEIFEHLKKSNEGSKDAHNTNESNKLSDKIDRAGVPVETIPLKEYYKLCFPDNRIGRKSDKTLIKELKEGGFEV